MTLPQHPSSVILSLGWDMALLLSYGAENSSVISSSYFWQDASKPLRDAWCQGESKQWQNQHSTISIRFMPLPGMIAQAHRGNVNKGKNQPRLLDCMMNEPERWPDCSLATQWYPCPFKALASPLLSASKHREKIQSGSRFAKGSWARAFDFASFLLVRVLVRGMAMAMTADR